MIAQNVNETGMDADAALKKEIEEEALESSSKIFLACL